MCRCMRLRRRWVGRRASWRSGQLRKSPSTWRWSAGWENRKCLGWRCTRVGNSLRPDRGLAVQWCLAGFRRRRSIHSHHDMLLEFAFPHPYPIEKKVHVFTRLVTLPVVPLAVASVGVVGSNAIVPTFKAQAWLPAHCQVCWRSKRIFFDAQQYVNHQLHSPPSPPLHCA